MTEATVIDVEQANALLDAAVADRGADYRYEFPGYDAGDPSTCYYWHPALEDPSEYHDRDLEQVAAGKPGCIVGHAFHAAGVRGEWLARNEGQGVGSLSRCASHDGLLTVTPDAQLLLAFVQSHQDGGAPWGEAVRQGREDWQRHVMRRDREAYAD